MGDSVRLLLCPILPMGSGADALIKKLTAGEEWSISVLLLYDDCSLSRDIKEASGRNPLIS